MTCEEVGMTERGARDCRVAIFRNDRGGRVIRAYAIRPYWREREY